MASSATQPRALAIVTEEHQAILQLFDQISRGERNRQELVDEVLVRLDIHQQLKREVLYPALEPVDADAVEEMIEAQEEIEDMLDDLDVEEADAEDEDEIADSDGAEPGDEDEDEAEDDEGDEDDDMSAMTDLGDQLRSHFEEEEETLARIAAGAEIDLDEIGRAMEARREELRRELGETGVVGSGGGGR